MSFFFNKILARPPESITYNNIKEIVSLEVLNKGLKLSILLIFQTKLDFTQDFSGFKISHLGKIRVK